MARTAFKKIEIKNFLSFGNDIQTYVFNQKGMCLIVGQNKDKKSHYDSSNGSGKSSFFSALSWCIFGETDKGIKSDEVVNYIEQQDCFVKLELNINDSEYRIERYRKHKKHKNNLLLFRDGKDLTQTVNSLTQGIINNLVGDAKTFFNSIIFSQEMMVNFLKLRLGERKEIIEKILRLNKLNEISKRLTEKWKIIGDKKNNAEKDLKYLNIDILSQKKLLVNYKDDCKLKKEEIKIEILKLEKDIEKINKIDIEQIKQWGKESQSLKEKCSQYVSKYDVKQSLIKDYIFYIKENKKILDKINQKQKEIEKAQSNPDKCPVCDNQINKNKFDFFIKKIEKDIKENQAQIKQNKTKQEEIKNNIKTNYVQYNKKDLFHLKNENERAKNKINQYKEYYLKIDQLDEEKQLAVVKMKELKNQRKSVYLEDFVTKTQEDIESKEKKIPVLQEQILKCEEELSNYNFLIEALDIKNDKGIKSYIMSSNLPILNQRLESYLVSIFSHPISVIFNNQFQETIKVNGRSISYSNLSGGEKKRLDVAISLTLFDLVRLNFLQNNLLLIDEALDSLDSEGQQVFLNIFKTISESHSVYLISHSNWIKDMENPEGAKDFLKDIFDQILVVEKENSFSKLRIL